MNDKGQEGAPFEVLVSVVIMGFVIIVALQAMNTVTTEQCKAQIRAEGSLLKTKVHDVVAGKSVTFTFDPPTCFGQKDETIQLRTIENEALCSAICGITKKSCIVFYYRAGADTGEEFMDQQCLQNASINTSFLSQGPCALRDGFDLVDFKNAIPRGSYTLVNGAQGSGFPQICAYKKSVHSATS